MGLLAEEDFEASWRRQTKHDMHAFRNVSSTSEICKAKNYTCLLMCECAKRRVWTLSCNDANWVRVGCSFCFWWEKVTSLCSFVMWSSIQTACPRTHLGQSSIGDVLVVGRNTLLSSRNSIDSATDRRVRTWYTDILSSLDPGMAYERDGIDIVLRPSNLGQLWVQY
jgi:hypothetical protein